MSLASLLGDDEHTAKDDAYTRAMKSRKWVVISAAATFAVWTGQFSASDFSVVVGSVNVGQVAWRKLTGFGLSYSTFQYLLLILQLWGRYPYLLIERFGLRELEKASRAQTQVDMVAMELAGLRGEISGPVIDSSRPDKAYNPASMPPTVLASRMDGLETQLAKLQALADSLPDQPKPTAIYQMSEVMIDVIRLGSPAIAAAIAIYAIVMR